MQLPSQKLANFSILRYNLDMLKSIWEYSRAVWRWAWVIVVGIIGGGATYALNMLPQVRIPLWVWVALAVLGLFIAQFLAFHKIRERLTPVEQIEKILTCLAEFREIGVQLRNDGEQVFSKGKLNDWLLRVKSWHNEVLSEVTKLSTAEASLFDTEDRVDTQRYRNTPFSGEQRLYLAILNKDIEKILELVQRLAPQNLAQRSGIQSSP